ncbi:chromosome segregation protein SMC [Limibacillus halophilus]
MHFTKLRLTGFKSFVDPTEVPIEPGMTGIVGPNGCGKSNLVEALRWVMGETSAKRMRGGEMDDVIFAGTSNRPSRNLAEVALLVDNAGRRAPAQFNEAAELEVVRRIQRGSGSNYRVNGKEVRARDVQLLFADLASGAHSTALVSQGRIGAIISAKPTERRSLLEEAAGITGLHSRRHEAELRLRAAETNLERLDDVVGTLESQLNGLRKQVRQATRYRNIADQLRRAEALLLYIDGEAAKGDLAKTKERLEAARGRVTELTEEAARRSTLQADLAAKLPELRNAEASAAAALQRLLVERDNLEREERQLAEAARQARERLEELGRDRERAQGLMNDAGEARARLDAETDELTAASDGQAEAEAAARADLDARHKEVVAAEEVLGELGERIAADAARAASLERRIDEFCRRLDRLGQQLSEAKAQQERLGGETLSAEKLAEASESREAAEASLAQAEATLEQAETALAEVRGSENETREAAEAARRAQERLEAEAAALAALVEPAEGEIWPALIDAVKVSGGYEQALGAALGDELEASGDEAAPVHWLDLPPLAQTQALPAGAEPLADKVKGPKALSRALSQIGVVTDAAAGKRLQAELKPGQRLVTKEGALWRWDGYSVREGAPTAAAQRLEQRNRLAELREAIAEAAKTTAAAEEARQAKSAALADAQEAEREARENQRAAYRALSEAREGEASLKQQAAAQSARLANLAEQIERLEGEREEAQTGLTDARREYGELPDLAAERARANDLRAELAELKGRHGESLAALNRLVAEAATRRRRLESIQAERSSWTQRAEGAEKHLSELGERAQTLEAELEVLESKPEGLKERREALAEKVAGAEGFRREAADALAQGESAQIEADRGVKQAEAELAEAREQRVRIEGQVEQAEIALQTLEARVRERLECEPEEVLALAEHDPGQELPARHELVSRTERLTRERENIGPVNLRAEQEAQEMQQQIDELQAERDDLIAAISRLRQGISSLNREGRERLLKAFETVNEHFQELFVRLFGGGRAHLALTEAEDPLDAGLEIFASPPGKRLQVMSLLSGGEQALTALSLLFACFLTNPAPICVLDEVDAPLDDANVDRFCTLVSELSRSTQTRFLVVTHHRMTMARVDRLYGVTMAERGVSQLVSVDLERAEQLRETA